MQITRQKLFLALLGCLFLFNTSPAGGQEVSIEYASGKVKDTMYLVDVDLQLQLNNRILNALEHGVTLEMDVELELRRERKWIWNKLLEKDRLRYQLEYHPLSDNYVVSDFTTNLSEQYQSLSEALNRLSSVRDYPLIDIKKISGDKTYIVYVKAKLNIEELPPPLQPITFVSSEWHLESQWYEWNIR